LILEAGNGKGTPRRKHAAQQQRVGRSRMFRYLAKVILACAALATLFAASAAEAAQGVTDGTILIGAYGPITGAAAFIGLGGRDGMNLAVKEINEAGGINGRKLEVLFEDDAFSPARALAAVKKLVDEDKVFM